MADSKEVKVPTIQVVPTTPFKDQKPGTSGLRKKVVDFKKPHYLENFVQSIFDSLPAAEVKGSTLVVSGDGRYYNVEAINTIIKMAFANGVAGIILGVNGLMSTPAVSAVVRSRKAYGAIILTASHNPGGPNADFGIKYNTSNGGPAPESVTDRIFANSLKIAQYKTTAENPNFDISKVGKYAFGTMQIEVINATKDYADFMKTIFDFAELKSFVSRPDFSMVYDAMHGVAGPFVEEVFANELGCDRKALHNCVPKVDFGGGHPDPNLTYAHDLVEMMGLGKHKPAGAIPKFGAANDGDADRNMVLGNEFFVTPSDSVAIIAANAQQCIPYFKNGLKGVARSMPTSAALDRVAAALNVTCYEVPTGWKFFGNLMDAGRLSICGEESFGTGSDHIREKDGVWAVLAWLSILAHKNKNQAKFVSISDIVLDHWKKYGRNYYTRYDYEEVDAKAAKKVMDDLIALTKLAVDGKEPAGTFGEYKIKTADEFSYKDPVDGSLSSNQGIRFIFTDGSRIVYRLSGTGSVGATIRVYIEQYQNQPDKLQLKPEVALAPLIAIAIRISKIQENTGRNAPTVIT